MTEDLFGPTDLERADEDLGAPSFLAVDVETTRDFSAPRLLEFVIVRVERGVETATWHATPELIRDGELRRAAEALERLAAPPVSLFAAHNARFDRGVLAGILTLGRVRALPWLCTLKLARDRAPGLDNYRLPTVAAYYGSAPFEHHRPLADARACAAIALGAWRRGARLSRREYLLPAVGRAG